MPSLSSYQSRFLLAGALALSPGYSCAQDTDVGPYGGDMDSGAAPQELEESGSSAALPVLVTFEAPIRPGQQAAVRELVGKMVEFNRAQEPHTLIYRVFIREDEQQLVFIEGYADSEAMRFHDDRFIQFFADEIAGLTAGGRLCIYGEVSAAYKAFAAQAGLEVEYFNSISGFQR